MDKITSQNPKPDRRDDPLITHANLNDFDRLETSGSMDDNLITNSLEFKAWLPSIDAKGKQVRTSKPSSENAGETKPYELPPSSLRARISKNLTRISCRISGDRYTDVPMVGQDGYSTEFFMGQWVDSPRPEERVLDATFWVAGWVLPKDLQPKTIRLIHNKVSVGEMEMNVFRPDVSAAFCLDTNFHHWGYGMSIDLRSLSEEGLLWVTAVFPDGSEQRLAYIQFCQY